jgi:hypothetical protein
MALGEARAKARQEFEDALQATGLTIERCREYVDRHPETKRPLYRVSKTKGVAGVAATFVHHIGRRTAA